MRLTAVERGLVSVGGGRGVRRAPLLADFVALLAGLAAVRRSLAAQRADLLEHQPDARVHAASVRSGHDPTLASEPRPVNDRSHTSHSLFLRRSRHARGDGIGRSASPGTVHQTRIDSSRIPSSSAAPTARGAPDRSRGCFSVPAMSDGTSLAA